MISFNPLADPCLSCGLWREKKNPCIRPKEYRKGGLVFIGEAPGENEDNANNVFVGRAGEILRAILDRLGVGYYTLLNAVACRPTNGNGDNRAPNHREIGFCSSFLMEDIRLLEPSKLICLGRVAAKAVGFPDIPLGELRHKVWMWNWTENALGMPLDASTINERQSPATQVRVTYHPAAGLRPGKANLIKELENDLKEYCNDSMHRGTFGTNSRVLDNGSDKYYKAEVPENKALTFEGKCGILPVHDEETIKEAIDSMNEVVIDIETSGFFKDHDAFPFDNKGTILNIGTDKGQVEGDLGRPWETP